MHEKLSKSLQEHIMPVFHIRISKFPNFRIFSRLQNRHLIPPRLDIIISRLAIQHYIQEVRLTLCAIHSGILSTGRRGRRPWQSPQQDCGHPLMDMLIVVPPVWILFFQAISHLGSTTRESTIDYVFGFSSSF